MQLAFLKLKNPVPQDRIFFSFSEYLEKSMVHGILFNETLLKASQFNGNILVSSIKVENIPAYPYNGLCDLTFCVAYRYMVMAVHTFNFFPCLRCK